MTLRPALADDEPFLYRVYASTRERELRQLGWEERQREAFLRMQFDAQSRYYRERYPDAAYDVVVAGGEPVGRLTVARLEDEIRIVDLALLPEHRGAGIGTRLLGELIAEAEAVRTPLRAHVERFNRALSLYERLGFALVADHGAYLLLERAPEGVQLKTAS